jgi:predicted ATPase
MQLLYLEIEKFRNLVDFRFDLANAGTPVVLVGGNGTGKSNLLEALACIFADLDLDKRTEFSYRIAYKLKNEIVEIMWSQNSPSPRLSVVIDGVKSSRSALKAKARRRLPRFVFGYYSGSNDRLASYFQAHEKRYYDQLKGSKVKGDPAELRPLFYARLVHSQFVLLAFFSGDKVVRKFLRENLRIEGLDSVLFVTSQPGWAKKNSKPEKFWKARGEVRDFLEKLYRVSLAPMQQTWRVQLPFGKSTAREHRYFYLQSEEEVTRLAAQYGSEQRFFAALESTYIADVIKEVRIKVKVRGADGSLGHRELSEGEQQLLTVLGLLRFTRESDSLFLLDEPDTHLNPAWSLRYLDLLDEVVGGDTSSQLIMATHDPLVIAGLEKQQVRIFSREPKSGIVQTSMPEQDPRGMGFAGLLTSDIYGLRSQLDLKTLHVLDRKRELATKPELSDDEVLELREINQELLEVGLEPPIRDPLFKEFVEAMAELDENEGPGRSPTLTREQQAKQRELALNVLKKLGYKNA